MTNSPPSNVARIFAFAALAWLVMVMLIGMLAFAAWIAGWARDPDMTGPFELAMVFAMVTAAPFAAGAFGIMAPLGVVADRFLAARTARIANAVVGACLAVPALMAWLVFATLLWSRRPLLENIAGFFKARYRPEQIAIVGILLVGGAIIGLAFRRRPESARSAHARAAIANN